MFVVEACTSRQATASPVLESYLSHAGLRGGFAPAKGIGAQRAIAMEYFATPMENILKEEW